MLIIHFEKLIENTIRISNIKWKTKSSFITKKETDENETGLVSAIFISNGKIITN